MSATRKTAATRKSAGIQKTATTRKAASTQPTTKAAKGPKAVPQRVEQAQRGIDYSPTISLATQQTAPPPARATTTAAGRPTAELAAMVASKPATAAKQARRQPTTQTVDTGTTWAQRYDVIDTWGVLLSDVYVHLPIKRALYGYDPLRALEALRRQVPLLTEEEFHRELSVVINRLRDAHTQHINASVNPGLVARLPFLVESYGPHTAPRFVVTKVAEALVSDSQFRAGAELLTWNAVPFTRVVDRHAEHETGGRPDARRARALESLTFRALGYAPRPDEEAVVITFRPEGARKAGGTGSKKIRTITFTWRTIDTSLEGVELWSPVAVRAIHSGAERVRLAKKLMFNPSKWEADFGSTAKVAPVATQRRAAAATAATAPGDVVESVLPDVISAKVIGTARRPIGYIRLWSFDIDDDQVFLDEVSRIIGLLPQMGLVIDVRANPGGNIYACERILQLFTDSPIIPARFALRATPLTTRLAETNPDLAPWADSLQQAMETGEQYSQHLPISDADACNDTGRRYPGPSVCVTDANTYSCGDLFAAGYFDHQIGSVVSVGEATGAGGANVWGYFDLQAALAAAGTVLPTLPDGFGLSMSIRRMTRTGAAEGLGIEDVGVRGIHVDLTYRDLFDSNTDLLKRCIELL